MAQRGRFKDLSTLVLAMPAGLAVMAVFDARQARPSFILVLVAAWISGFAARSRRRHAFNLAVFLSSLAVIPLLAGNHSAADFLYESLFTLSAMALGAFFARHVDHAEAERLRLLRITAERRDAADRAVLAERARIARELHDVVGHSVSAMTLQASGARLRLERGDRATAREALGAVEDLGHRALSDMRRMLGLLREDSTDPLLRPGSGLASLPGLVENLRATGFVIEVSGAELGANLPLAIDVAAYRLIEAALMLALSAKAVAATVAVRCVDRQVEIELRDSGRRAELGTTAEAVLCHRVAVYNGTVDITDGENGGRNLQACLPLEAAPT